jgi:hypothetical protein
LIDSTYKLVQISSSSRISSASPVEQSLLVFLGRGLT